MTTQSIDCTEIEVSAFTNWYDADRSYNDSINLTKVHREADVELTLRATLEQLNNQKITKVTWMWNDTELMSLTGNVIPHWSLQANPTLNETLNFMMG